MKFPYQRVLIIGCGGAGKSVLARTMGEKFSLPVVHLDKLFVRAGGSIRDEAECDALLNTELKKPRWIIDGNYQRTLERRLEAAECCIFLDLDMETCLKGAYARAQAVDPSLEQWIVSFREEIRPAVFASLERSGKPCFIFHERWEAYEWLDAFVGTNS